MRWWSQIALATTYGLGKPTECKSSIIFHFSHIKITYIVHGISFSCRFLTRSEFFFLTFYSLSNLSWLGQNNLSFFVFWLGWIAWIYSLSFFFKFFKIATRRKAILDFNSKFDLNFEKCLIWFFVHFLCWKPMIL